MANNWMYLNHAFNPFSAGGGVVLDPPPCLVLPLALPKIGSRWPPLTTCGKLNTYFDDILAFRSVARCSLASQLNLKISLSYFEKSKGGTILYQKKLSLIFLKFNI